MDYYELIKSTGLHLVSGGLLDQPHIWLMQYQLIESVVEMFDAIKRQENALAQKVTNAGTN